MYVETDSNGSVSDWAELNEDMEVNGEKLIMSRKDLLHLAVCSDLRRKILISLNEGKKPLAELRNGLEISSTTTIHVLRDLEKGSLIFQDKDKNYALTVIGRIATLKLIDFGHTAETLKKHERFWFDHDLSGIPVHLLEKIGLLNNSNVIQINTLDIIKTHGTYVSSIKNAKWVKGVSPIFSKDYPLVFKELIEKNIDTKLILTRAVLEKLINVSSLENLRSALSTYNLEIFVTEENLKVAFTITDTFFSLGLFSNNGVYDTTHDLTAVDKRAVSWGVELFDHYRKKAKKYET